jgi:hypothetical protein
MPVATADPPGLHMAKKKPAKETLYVEIEAALKRRLERAAASNGRKLTAEVARALDFYLSSLEGTAKDDGEDRP